MGHRRASAKTRAIELGVGAVALGVSWFIARQPHTLPKWEEDLTVRINDLPNFLAPPLWPIMQLGNLWMVAGVPAGLWFATKRVRPPAAGALATGAAWGLAKVIKAQVGRGRPADFITDIHLRESGVHGLGYVSGHAAVAFAAATVIAVYVPKRWRAIPFILASLTAFSRIYYGAHLPLDVVGGAGLGIACGSISLLIFGEPPSKQPAQIESGTSVEGSPA
jgi:undecaprenyl-diphosphatase